MKMIRTPTLILTLIVALGLTLPSGHSETLPGPIPADVLRIVDGDTVHVRAHVWIDQSIEISVRIADIDAPEIGRPKCREERAVADQAKAELTSLIGAGSVALHNVRLGKYAGRVVADVETENGLDVGEELLARHLASPYEADMDWCPIASTDETDRPG